MTEYEVQRAAVQMFWAIEPKEANPLFVEGDVRAIVRACIADAEQTPIPDGEKASRREWTAYQAAKRLQEAKRSKLAQARQDADTGPARSNEQSPSS